MSLSDNIQRNTVYFEVDSHLLLELGERLVAKPSIALAELVKNSYDADSNRVTITFSDVEKEGGTIIVEDDGEGMTFHDFKTKWMRIGTDEKERNPISNKYKRVRTGSKGIGRFACRFISKKLELISIAVVNHKKELIKAVFYWDKIKSGDEVRDFSIEVSREILQDSEPVGTKLVLRGTRNLWSENDIITFKKEILGLVNPFPWETSENIFRRVAENDPGFIITIRSPEFPYIEGLLSDSIIKSSWGKITGTLDNEGNVRYKIQVTSTEDEYEYTPKQKYSRLGGASFIIYMFSLGKLTGDVPGLTLRDIRRLGREHGGVKVFLDGFRVFRYGEPGNDWLKLEFDRSRRLSSTRVELLPESKGLHRPMLSLPGNNQLFGAVFLSRNVNPNISVTVTRDRLVENKPFEELRSFVRLGLDWMTIIYASHRTQMREKEKELEEKTDPIDTLNTVEKIVDEQKDKIGEETTNVIKQYINLAKEDVIKIQEESITQISMMRVLASTGTMITVFNHELSIIYRRLTEITSDLQRFLGELPSNSKNAYRIILADIKAWGYSIEKVANMIGLMLGKDAREKKRELSLRIAIDRIFAPFKTYLDEYGIETLNDSPSDIRTPPMYESELHSILVNLMTNSIKALSEVEDRKIWVKSQISKGKLIIEFLDSGNGLEPDRWEEVFNPFVSYSDPNIDFGFGTGLGLTIVRDIVASYEGNVKFVKPPLGWSTCLRIELPR